MYGILTVACSSNDVIGDNSRCFQDPTYGPVTQSVVDFNVDPGDVDGDVACEEVLTALDENLAASQQAGVPVYAVDFFCGYPGVVDSTIMCPPGFTYDFASESCKAIVPVPVVPVASPCPGGGQPPCVGHVDPPLPLASDGIGFSTPSNVALPVHPTLSPQTIRETCGVCGDVDETEEEL